MQLVEYIFHVFQFKLNSL